MAGGQTGRGPGRFLAGHARALAAYPLDLVTTAARAWHRFFFTPADPTPLGLIRIIVGGLSTWSLLTLGLGDVESNLGNNGWVSPEALRYFWSDWPESGHVWSLWLLVPDRFLSAVWVVCLIVLVAFTLGLASRVTSILAWAIMVSSSRRVPVLYFGFDQTLLSWMLYLAFTGASGQAFSLDRLIARRRASAGAGSSRIPVPTVSANLALRLIQLHLCLIYAVAGLAKLQGEAWWNGEAMLMILLAPEYRVGDYLWLAAYPRFLNFLTHATVALEVLYPVFVWVRVLRPLMITGMILLHVGIDLTMGLREFSLAMIAGNLAFVSGSWLRGEFRTPERAGALTPSESLRPTPARSA
jgi:hypothetical protein